MDELDYLRSNKKHGPWRMMVILGLGAACPMGIAFLLGCPFVALPLLDFDMIGRLAIGFG